MRHLAVLLSILTVLAAISGCAVKPAGITVQHAVTRCPRPARPELPTVDPSEHLCSPANLDKLLTIVDRQCGYIEQQDAALDCYERQAGGKQ